MELLREIVHYYTKAIPPREPEKGRQSYKPPWSAFESLAIASKALRQLALESWFEVYFSRSPDDLLHVWPEFELWTRELHCVELGTDLQIRPVQWDLRAFRRLCKLRVDFDPSQSNAMLLMRFDHPRHIASQLQELEVHDVSWPSPMVLRVISQAFPGLRILKLSQDLVWCNLCNICRFATFKDHPPDEIAYVKFVGLPKHYAMYLMPLTHLHTVELTISYGLGGSTSLSKNNDLVWTGECDACMDMMFTGDDFKREWIGRKKTIEKPPSLRSVIWHFRHKNLEDVIVDVDDEPEGGADHDEEDDT
ncbi:hypothetical protein BN946_scf184806.g10 [Trametes cinnabarina]|uniref:F-box domain-containing protein n=1 Tax=Pycnoporus cinnabarinus TaxID=5643 RepID=A0A060SCG6_PYCCI|nr:hypothetical protein BN946_scf184806.g10 [Trametes cinnabarina]